VAPRLPQGRPIVIDDVNADPRYLACSLETKSEIVVPVFIQRNARVRRHGPFERAEREDIVIALLLYM
jgi:hypothetical protein